MSLISSQNFKYVPDMKDPRDYLFREGDFEGIHIDKNKKLDDFISKCGFHPAFSMIFDILLSKEERLKAIFKKLDINKIEYACKMKYGQFTLRAIFQFLRNYLDSLLLTEGKTNFVYWRISEDDVPCALQKNTILTGIPVYDECLSYIEDINLLEFKIPSNNNSILGYVNVLLTSCDETVYTGKMVIIDENNEQHYLNVSIPRYILSSCEPIYWCIQFDTTWYNQKEEESTSNKFVYEYSIDYYHNLKLASL